MKSMLRFSSALALALPALYLAPGLAAQCQAPPSYGGPADAGAPTPTIPSPSAPTPSTPTGPTPSTPTGPGPVTPNGPRVPVTPRGRGARTPRGGIVIPMTRQSTSKEILGVDWDHPVAKQFAPKADGGKTSAAAADYAWPAPEAFKRIAGDDPRPLLVLRECHSCKGTEHALFSRRLNNEKTQLMLNWFHCVKLPAEIARPNHPFHNVFKEGFRVAPHLFICTADGANKIPFTGAQSQSKLQKELGKILKVAYRKSPKPAIKSMLRYLSKFDMFDLRESELLIMMDTAREESGPKASSVKKLQAELAKVRRDKARVMKAAKAVCDLKLKVVKARPAPSAKAGSKKGD